MHNAFTSICSSLTSSQCQATVPSALALSVAVGDSRHMT